MKDAYSHALEYSKIARGSNKIILDLCGGTGAWSKPYKEAGYTVLNITLPDFDINYTDVSSNDYFIFYNKQKDNKLEIRKDWIYGILAAPPCTQFSIARNDKTAKKPRDLRDGMRTINSCLRIIHECLYSNYRKSGNGLKFWALENPYSGYLKRFLGKPAFVFEPCDFGDPYTKKTALWGEFNEPIKNPVEPIKGSMVKHASHFKDIKPVDPEYQKKLGKDARTIRRSITPSGFSEAFYKANK